MADPSRRYDRQLRIWGTAGQSRLEAARVLVLNAGPTSTETLKNLVLGGIASFTLVDGGKVSPGDLGNKCVQEAPWRAACSRPRPASSCRPRTWASRARRAWRGF
jgi:amyloid beta precursor protein binding protein 1